MASTWGENIKLSIFGGSHTEAIGVVLDNLPPNEKIDMEKIRVQMARRAPGKDKTATTRLEADEPQVLSGLFNGVTTGAPLAAIIANTNTRSKDYSDLKIHPRPGHADYTASVRYNGANDIRGGGHFSGRLTACLVFAGAVCRQILERRGITIGAHAYAVGSAKDTPFDPVNVSKDDLNALNTRFFADQFPQAEEKMRAEIEAARLDATASAASSSAPQSVSRQASAVLCSAASKTSLHRFYTASPPSKAWSSARALMLPVCAAAKITTHFTTTKMVSSARKRTTRAAFWAASQRACRFYSALPSSPRRPSAVNSTRSISPRKQTPI